jgi:hypothetical protein
VTLYVDRSAVGPAREQLAAVSAVILSSSVHEALFVERRLSPVVRRDRQPELDETINDSATEARYIHYRRNPVVLALLGVDSRIALSMWPVVIVSALWWARYVRTQLPSRRMITVSSSPNRAMSAAMSGRRVRGSVRFCAASIHLGKIKVSSDRSGNSPRTFDW